MMVPGIATLQSQLAGASLTSLLAVQTAVSIFAPIGEVWTYIRLTSDQTTSSGSGVDITGIAIAPTANSRLEIEGCFLMRTASTSVSPRFNMVWPSGMSDGVGSIQIALANGTYPTLSLNSTEAHGSIGATFTTLAGNWPDTSNSYPVWIRAALFAGASPTGSWKMQFYSSGGGTNVTIKAGSYVKYRWIT